jgi:hypothetical protein
MTLHMPADGTLMADDDQSVAFGVLTTMPPQMPSDDDLADEDEDEDDEEDEDDDEEDEDDFDDEDDLGDEDEDEMPEDDNLRGMANKTVVH